MIVNQKFIAQEAGVSQKTVSLYFKEQNLIGRKSRKKIKEVVKRHNYFPNQAARSIRSNRFNRIACVVVQYGLQSSVMHSHMMAYINGASIKLAEHGYSLVVEPVFVDLSGSEVIFPEFFSMRSVDGIIGIAGGWIPPLVDQKIAELELPTIWLNRKSGNPRIDCLLFDETAGAIELVAHFLKQGIRKIIWFGPEFEEDIVVHYSSRVRYQAVKAELAQNGGTCFPFFCHTGEMLDGKAREILTRLSKFDGVICYSYPYRHTILLEAIAARVDLTSKRIGHFASMWEFHPRDYDFFDYVVMPEDEMGCHGAEYLLKILCGENADNLLAPLKGRLYASTPAIVKENNLKPQSEKLQIAPTIDNNQTLQDTKVQE